jgi:NAD+ kinase
VVVATPAGSVGYAADAGGPALYPGTGALGVVPVAPFVTDAHHWVVRDDRVAVTVEREEPTALVVDGRRRRLAPAGGTVTVAADGRLEVLLAPESPPVHGGELEKH